MFHRWEAYRTTTDTIPTLATPPTFASNVVVLQHMFGGREVSEVLRPLENV